MITPGGQDLRCRSQISLEANSQKYPQGRSGVLYTLNMDISFGNGNSILKLLRGVSRRREVREIRYPPPSLRKYTENTLSEQMAHSTVDLHLKEISEFLHGSVMKKNFTLQ